MKTRGERLKARRLEMKLTLREVAEAVDISIAGVQNLERGDVMPSLEIGIALAKCLRKPVHWVLYGTEYDPDRIPVIGTTESGPDEEWKPGQVPNTERFLPFISQRNTVYALTISNLAQGNYQPGDFLLVDSALELVPGEDVLVRDTAGNITIQRLARFDDENYYLDGTNSQRPIFRKSDLEFVHQIVGTIKSFMVEGR